MTEDWQRIETAPKDGTEVLGWEPFPLSVEFPNGFYEVIRWSIESKEWMNTEGWVKNKVIFWSPLPTPPKWF